jgi:diphthamide biosynthesis enzyme Dph1/Dph2-like protein
MDIIHIEARYKDNIDLPKSFIEKLPKKVILFTTVQFMNSLNNIKEQLESNGIDVAMLRPRHTQYEGQILGCSTEQISLEGEYIYIGDGLFHPKALLIRNNTRVHTFNPKTGDERILDRNALKSIFTKLKVAYSRFITAERVGVLITLKPGQMKPKLAKDLEIKYPKKKFYYLVDNTFSFESLADFRGLDVFLNTMCERIGLDDMDVQNIPIINIEDLFDIEKGVFDSVI